MYLHDGHEGALAEMASWSDAESAKMAAAIDGLSPSLRFGRLAARLAKAANVSEEKANDYIATLVHLWQTRHSEGTTGPKLAEVAVDYLRAHAPSNVPSEAQIATFSAFLEKVLRPDGPVGISAKGLDVVMEQPRLYHDSRVMTDVRPLFRDDKKDKIGAPLGAVITHSLRITAFSKTHREQDEVFFTLDSEDLQELKAVVERAIQKEDALRKDAAAITRLVD